MTRTATAAAAVALGLLALLGCAGGGGGGGDGGSATLWITRDRGDTLLLERRVPAGVTAMQALKAEADVTTRYGGRFVQAIDGLEGSLTQRRDWFFFVNGYEADRSAAEYRLHDGDVLWWDFRSWERSAHVAVVVGAFPEPFLHGYGGERRAAVVRYGDRSLETEAKALAKVIRASSVAPVSVPVPEEANALVVLDGRRIRFRPSREQLPATPGDRVVLVLVGAAAALARDPSLFRFRYEVP